MKAKKNHTPSGKFVLRVPQALHSRLRAMAHNEGISLNQAIIQKLHLEKSHNEPSNLSWLLNAWPDQVLALIKFGSQVRGEASDNSDVDLLIVLDQKTDLSTQLYRQWTRILPEEFSRWSPQFAHLSSTIQDVGSLWFEVALEGEFLWERNDSVREFIYQLKDAIASGYLIRKWSHGQPYWIRNFPEFTK